MPKVKKLQKLQTHLRDLNAVVPTLDGQYGHYKLPSDKQDNTRFSIRCIKFECGMPACVAGHAKIVFPKLVSNKDDNSWLGLFEDFMDFFDLSDKETTHICEMTSYTDKDPTPKEAARHIQDVIDGLE